MKIVSLFDGIGGAGLAAYYAGMEYFTKHRRQLVFTDKSQTVLATLYKENAKSMYKRNKFGLEVVKPPLDKLYFRKLTPLECERLQGFPDNYTECISNTRRYQCLGNAFTVPVIAHILKHLKGCD